MKGNGASVKDNGLKGPMGYAAAYAPDKPMIAMTKKPKKKK